jgi:transcription termination factor NusB
MSWFTERRDAIKKKARGIVKKVEDFKPKVASVLGASFDLGLSADIDAAIRVILDDSFLKVIDRAVFALDSTIDKTSQELQNLVQQVFDNLFELEKKLEKLMERFFQDLSNLIKDIKTIVRTELSSYDAVGEQILIVRVGFNGSWVQV